MYLLENAFDEVGSDHSQLRVERKSDDLHVRLGLWKVRSLN